MEERSGTAQIPSFLEEADLWEDKSGDGTMGISVVKTVEFVPLKPSEVVLNQSEVTAPVPTQPQESAVSGAMPQTVSSAPTMRIVSTVAPSRLADSLRTPLMRLLVFSVLSLLAAALVWLLLR